jgi:hypothetical protein
VLDDQDEIDERLDSGTTDGPPPSLAREAQGQRFSRREAAERLGVSPRSIARFEADGMLHAERDDRGRPWFDPAEVSALAEQRRRDTGDPQGGELAARAFALFAAGGGARDLVIRERVPPDAAEGLYLRWVALGDGVVIDTPRARRLADALGMPRLDLDVVERALGALRRLASSLEAPCPRCGRVTFVGAGWRAYGPTWRCSTCRAAEAMEDDDSRS